MDATFTEEQELLADVAQRIAERVGVDAPVDDEPGAGWTLVADAGLLGLRMPVDAGGGGATGVEAAIAAEALGRSASRVPFVGPVLAAELLVAAGAANELLEPIGAGERRVTVALDRTLATVGTASPTGARIGWDASGAEEFVGLTNSSDGSCRVALLPGPGSPLASTDLTRELVELHPTEPIHYIGDPLDGDALIRWEALAQVLLCADMMGAMRGALDMAVEYAKRRVQFGRPIGSFQAIQHLAADQHVSTEAARSATYYASWSIDGLPPRDALLAARTAKAYVSRRAQEVTEAVLQIYGGIGHTWECSAHYFLRRVMLDRATLGDESVQLVLIADTLLADTVPVDLHAAAHVPPTHVDQERTG